MPVALLVAAPTRPATWVPCQELGSAGEPVPHSLKIQLACCLLATGEVQSIEDGLARVAQSY